MVSVDLLKLCFVARMTFCRVKMWHQNSVIHDIKCYMNKTCTKVLKIQKLASFD